MTETASDLLARLPAGVRWTALATSAYLLAFALIPGVGLSLLVTVGFALICPGLLLIDWLDTSDRVIAATLIVSASLAANILVATILAGFDVLNGWTGMVATTSVTLALGLLSYAQSESHNLEARVGARS